MIRRLFRAAVRRAAILPLSALDDDTRAYTIDRLWADMQVSVVVRNTRLTFFAPSPLLRSRAVNLAAKEPDMLAWLDRLQADDVLWDVGANVGVFNLYAAVARRCRVLAFEPAAANYFALTRNLQLNGVTDRVTAYCLALSGSTALGTLNLDSAASGAALSHFGAAGESSPYAGRPAALAHGMVGITVDDFIARFAATRPTHLKMDVDGLEWAILQGGGTTLADRHLRSLMVELSLTHTDQRQRAIDFLEARGWRLDAEGPPQGSAGEQAANHLFVRR